MLDEPTGNGLPGRLGLALQKDPPAREHHRETDQSLRSHTRAPPVVAPMPRPKTAPPGAPSSGAPMSAEKASTTPLPTPSAATLARNHHPDCDTCLRRYIHCIVVTRAS